MATTKKTSAKKAASVKKAAKTVKHVGCANRPRSAAEIKLLDSDKVGSSMKTMIRWLPEAFGDDYKSQAFIAWLKNPTDPTLAATLEKRFNGAIAGTSLSKWLRNFANGCKRAESRYPRAARGRVKDIEAALKKMGNGVHVSAHEKKRLAS